MANPLTMGDLVLRLVKGTPLTAAEFDNNITTIRDFCNSLADLISTSLNTDGTLKANTVASSALSNRSVTASKLAADALPFHQDTSAVQNIFRVSPTPAITAYADGQIFFVRANNSVTSTCQFGVGSLDLKLLKKKGGLELDANDILKNQVFAVAYFGGAFELISTSGSGSGSGSSGVGGGFGGYNTYEPADSDVPAAAAPVSVGTFAHGLQLLPSRVSVALVCASAEHGYGFGDVVSIDQITDSLGQKAAFSVATTAQSITVTKIQTPYIPHATTGALSLITPASWKVRIYAEKTTSTSTPTFPALDFSVGNARGAWANGNDLFIVQGSSALGPIMTRTNIANNNVQSVASAALGSCNVAPFKRADLASYFIFNSSSGEIFFQPQQSPYLPVLITSNIGGSVFGRKPVHFFESAGTITQVLAAGNAWADPVSSIPLVADGRTVNHGGAIGTINGGATIGTNLNLTSASILDTAGAAGNAQFIGLHHASDALAMFQYSSLKKRIYVISARTQILSIFQIVGNTSGYSDPNSIYEWWIDVNRLAKLQHIKSIALAGAGMNVTAYDWDHYMIDVNLNTGEERAIILSRGYGQNAASVTRIPWKE